MWTLQKFVQVVFLSKSSLRERRNQISCLRQSRAKKCPLLIGNCGIVSTLQTCEHYIIGLPFPIYLYCDHKPILYLWGRKGQLSHRFFRYQVIITKFQNLKIIWTPGSNLAFPDIFSRNITMEEYQKHQLQHERIPRDIEFDDEHGTPVTYQCQPEDNPNDTCNDFYPIKYTSGNEKKIPMKNNTKRRQGFYRQKYA